MTALTCGVRSCCSRQTAPLDKPRLSSRYSDLDGHYAWIIALTSFTGHVLIYGIIWSSGVFYDIFQEMFDNASWLISLTATLSTTFTFGFSPVPGALINKYGHRVITMIGGAVSSFGLILSAFAPNMYYLAASFGVITGIGFGTAYLAIISIVPLYFERYRTIALGIAVSGVGMGTFIYPPFIRYLVHVYGVRGSLIITGAITLNLCLCGAIMRPPRVPSLLPSSFITKDETETSDSTEKSSESSAPLQERNRAKNRFKSFLSLLNLHIFRSTSFLFLCMNNFFALFGISIVYVHLVAYSETRNVNKDMAAMLVSALGISNFAGRPLFGLFAKLPYCSAMTLYIVSYVIAGVVVLLLPMMTNFLGIVILTSAFGFLSASIGPLLPQLIVEILHVRLITSGYAYLLVFEALGCLLGPPAAGYSYDNLHVFAPSFYLAGTSVSISGAIMLIPYFLQKRGSRSRDKDKVDVIPIDEDSDENKSFQDV